jgi:hypothetical protein
MLYKSFEVVPIRLEAPALLVEIAPCGNKEKCHG